MATLEIFVSEPVHTNEPKSVWVEIEGAPPGAVLKVTLSQVQGRAPHWGPQTKQVTVGPSGEASASFTITLSGPTPRATLLVNASDDLATFYEPDAHSVEVLP